jgi:hypothetical protein
MIFKDVLNKEFLVFQNSVMIFKFKEKTFNGRISKHRLETIIKEKRSRQIIRK